MAEFQSGSSWVKKGSRKLVVQSSGQVRFWMWVDVPICPPQVCACLLPVDELEQLLYAVLLTSSPHSASLVVGSWTGTNRSPLRSQCCSIYWYAEAVVPDIVV